VAGLAPGYSHEDIPADDKLGRPMNPIILIHATPADEKRGLVQAIRETWVAEWGHHLIPWRFIYDRTYVGPAQKDEWTFDVDPGYWVMMRKTKAACRRALDQGYSHVFIICSDTYVVIPRLLASGYENHHYSGHRAGEGHAGGGCGYWLDGRAMRAVIEARTFNDYEDRWVGTVLKEAGIECFHDPRYWGAVHPYLDGIITVHLHQGDGMMDPQLLRDQHIVFMTEGEICGH
jgi:hypothetical protein